MAKLPKPPYVMGIDAGTSSIRAAIFDLKGKIVIFRDESYPLYTPSPGWAEQRPEDWWDALCRASRRAIADSGINPADIAGISADTTSCTVVLLDNGMKPIRPAIMWMDVRASAQAKKIKSTGHSALKYNGYNNVTPEWMPCKALWLKENEPANYDRAEHIVDCIDWMMYRLTGRLTASINTVSARWYYDRRSGGWPHDFYDMIGLEDLIEKFPKDVLDMGSYAGRLSKAAAEDLGLVAGIPVGEGGADAYVGMLGLNVVEPGKMVMITGSSHAHLCLSNKEVHAPGIFGSYPDAIVPGLDLIEAGQVSTGSIVNWFKNNFCGDAAEAARQKGCSLYKLLDDEAVKLPVGSEGLIVLDYFQGNRTPYTDPDVRGIIYGLTLKHTPYHIFRAVIEGICYGTENIFRNFDTAGLRPKEIYISGGAAKSRWWLQAHADVSNVPVFIPEVSEAPCLGSAILGAVAAGAYGSVQEAAGKMVSYIDRVEPDLERHQQYKFYADKYIEMYPLLKDWMHEVSSYKVNKLTIK